MKIRNRLFIFYIVPFVVVFSVSVFLVLSSSLRYSRSELTSKFLRIETARQAHLESVVHKYVDIVNLIVSKTRLKNLVAIYLEKPNPADLKEIRLALLDAQKAVGGIVVVNLVGLDGKIFASSDITYEGTVPHVKELMFNNVEETKVFITQDRYGIPMLYAKGPIKVDGEVICLVYFKTNPQDIYNVLATQRGYGKTEELYIMDKNGVIMTPLKITSSAPFSLTVKNKALSMCFNESSPNGRMIEDRNVLGNDVFSSFVYISSIDACLVAEISKTEFFSGTIKVILEAVLMGFVVVVFYIFISMYLSKVLVGPIERLRNAIEKKQDGWGLYSNCYKYQGWGGRSVERF